MGNGTVAPAILVTGATGTFGGLVAAALARDGRRVRVMVRDAARYHGAAAETVVGGFDDDAALDRALAGVSRVFLASFDRPEMLPGQQRLLASARRAGATHVVRISSMGVDEPRFGRILANHASGERQLEDSGLGFTHLRPSWVLQNFLPNSAATPVRNGAIRLPGGEGRVGFVDARDVAGVAAAILSKPEDVASGAIEVTGPAARTHAELAKALSDAAGLAVAYEDLAPAAYVAELRALGWSEGSIDSMDALFADIRAGGWARLTDEVRRLTGGPARGIEDFARDHAAAFRAV